MAKTKRQILVIDDEAAMRHMLRLVLERDGYAISEAAFGREGLDRLQAALFDFILFDIRMPELDGLGFLKEKARRKLSGTVIMMSAYGTIDTAVECMKQGAYDYVSKPFRPDEILPVTPAHPVGAVPPGRRKRADHCHRRPVSAHPDPRPAGQGQHQRRSARRPRP